MGAQIINFRPSGDQEWAQWAECAKPGAAPHFPADGDDAGIQAAKDNCRTCPVLIECLKDALNRGEQWGIWGGLTPAERTAIQRNVTRQARKTGEPRATVDELADVTAAKFTAEPLSDASALDLSGEMLTEAEVA
jgi:hypothetical protein